MSVNLFAVFFWSLVALGLWGLLGPVGLLLTAMAVAGIQVLPDGKHR